MKPDKGIGPDPMPVVHISAFPRVLTSRALLSGEAMPADWKNAN
ncbi:MAG TPA: hypothetical protein VGV87_24620 [Blastocatellia bacterium]|nr:hypothetical protein [Blastocatellia bacterium]